MSVTAPTRYLKRLNASLTVSVEDCWVLRRAIDTRVDELNREREQYPSHSREEAALAIEVEVAKLRALAARMGAANETMRKRAGVGG